MPCSSSNKLTLAEVLSIFILAKINIDNTSANVNLLEEEHGIAPGQACVFYSKNNKGYKVLGGGWITN